MRASAHVREHCSGESSALPTRPIVGAGKRTQGKNALNTDRQTDTLVPRKGVGAKGTGSRWNSRSSLVPGALEADGRLILGISRRSRRRPALRGKNSEEAGASPPLLGTPSPSNGGREPATWPQGGEAPANPGATLTRGAGRPRGAATPLLQLVRPWSRGPRTPSSLRARPRGLFETPCCTPATASP